MPADIFRQRFIFIHQLLYFILSKITAAVSIGFLQIRKRFCLAYGNQFDLRCLSLAGFAGLFHPPFHRIQIFSDPHVSISPAPAFTGCMPARGRLLINKFVILHHIGVQYNIIVYIQTVIRVRLHYGIFVIVIQDADLLKICVPLIDIVYAL